MSIGTVFPVNVEIRRFYRMYVRVPPGSTAYEIRRQAVEDIMSHGDGAIDPDPDIEIELHDIGEMIIDYDGAWEEDDEE